MCSACTKIEHGAVAAHLWEGKKVTIATGPYGEVQFIDDSNGRWELFRDPIYEDYWLAPVQNTDRTQGPADSLGFGSTPT